MSQIRASFKPWMLFAAGGLLLALFIALKLPRKGSPPQRNAPRPELAEAVPVVHLEPAGVPAPPVAETHHDPTSIRFNLRLSYSGDAATAREPLLFCVPPDRALTTEIESYRIGGQDFANAPEEKTQNDDKGTSPNAAAQAFNAAKGAGIEIKKLGIMRRWNIASVTLSPPFFAPYQALDPEKRADLEAVISLRWSEPFVPSPTPPYPLECDPKKGWGRVMARFVANPEALSAFQLQAPPLREGVGAQPAAPWNLAPNARRWARFRLKDEGLYQLKYDDLIAAGFPPEEVKPEAMRLFCQGGAVPLLRRGDAAAQKTYFRHSKSGSRYSVEKVYWATLAGGIPDTVIAPYPAAELAGEPIPEPLLNRTAVINRDRELKIESGNFLSIEKMEWVDAPIPAARPLDLPLDLPGYSPRIGNLEARLRFYLEETQPNYKIDLKKNGELLGSTTIKSVADVEKIIPIPPGKLKEGRNDLTLNLDVPPAVRSNDARTTVWLDDVRIEYPSRPLPAEGRLSFKRLAAEPGTASPAPAKTTVWTPVDPGEVASFAEGIGLVLGPDDSPFGTFALSERAGAKGFLWPSAPGLRVEFQLPESIPRTPPFEPVHIEDLTLEDQGCDDLIITHREFMEEAGRLAELHRKRGLKTRVVEIQSVYDNFSHGELTPEAIRGFIAFTLGHWRKGAPQTVTLFGDCTSDYLGLTKTDVKNWIPSYIYTTQSDHFASDYWMGAVAGTDDLPDFMIGRISVENREDAKNIVDKIAGYGTKKPGPWRARLGFVADDGGFVEPLEELRKEHSPAAFDQTRIYLNESMPLADNPYLPQQLVAEKRLKFSPAATGRIRDALNSGLATLTYYGHGSPNIWMEERIWFGGNSPNSDNQLLAGSGHCAFVTTMTCNTGAIDYPVPRSIAGGGWNICISEDMMRVKDGGAIALYVPSGPSVTGIQHNMSIMLNRSMFDEHLRPLGEIVALSAARYLASDHPKDLAYMLILLGDPAMELQVASPPESFAPPEAAYRPGGAIQAALMDVNPAQGRYVATLQNDGGETIWRTEGPEKDKGMPYEGGRIILNAPIPADAAPGEAWLKLYAWNDNAEAELSAAARIKIAWPRLEITNAQTTRGDNGETELSLAIANRGPLASQGAGIEIVVLPEDPSVPPIRRSISLDPGTTATLAIPLHGNKKASAVEARLFSDDDPKAQSPPESRRRRLALPAPPGVTELIGALSAWENSPDGASAKLKIEARSAAPEFRNSTLGLDDAHGSEILRQPMNLDAGTARAEIALATAQIARATSGTLWLAPAVPVAPVDGSVVEGAGRVTLPVAAIRRDNFDLRILPDSIRLDPESPSEGETIWVRFEAENSGALPTPPFTVGLYDKSPAEGGTIMPNHFTAQAQFAAEPLGPGQRRLLTLRTDPGGNAGDQVFCVKLDPQQGRGASRPDGLEASKIVHVRTKAKIERGATRLEQIDGGGGHKEWWLTGEVINRGETDAYGVTVVFYRTTPKTPENEVGRTVLSVAPAGKTEIARLRWKALEDDPAMRASRIQPVHEMRLNWRRSMQKEKE